MHIKNSINRNILKILFFTNSIIFIRELKSELIVFFYDTHVTQQNINLVNLRFFKHFFKIRDMH